MALERIIYMPQKSQNELLTQVVEDEKKVQIYLVSGMRLEGIIDSFDRFVIVMIDSDRKRNMIYKHAISTIIFD